MLDKLRKLNLVLAILILATFSVSCFNSNKNEIYYDISIKGWDVKITENATDTLNTQSFLPESELSFQFTKKVKTDCLQPNFEFYPIEMEKYLVRKLTRYLSIRSTIFPPSPNLYRNDKYFVIGWNLEDYNNFQCCDCKRLESQVIEKLNLKIIQSSGQLKFGRININ